VSYSCIKFWMALILLIVTVPAMDINFDDNGEEHGSIVKATDIATADDVIPEVATQWSADRHRVWTAKGDHLRSTDKAMFAALESTMSDPYSVHWARYLRREHRSASDLLQIASKTGHSWVSAQSGAGHHGVLKETTREPSSGTGHDEKAAQGSTKASGSESKTPRDGTEPLCDSTVRQHHGYFDIAKPGEGGADSTKSYFYWLFEARHQPESAPLVLWLQGGPGCSSMQAVVSENGPCTLAHGGKDTVPNEFSWTQRANVLYVDQPAGTGFSTGTKEELDRTQAEVSDDLYHFLQELMKAHPAYHKNDFYIFGESYAGHFVPAAAHRISSGNTAAEDTTEYIALRGIGIGNGMTDPEIQYASYPEVAYKHTSTLGVPAPVVSKQVYKEMKQAVPKCIDAIRQCKADAAACGVETEKKCVQPLISPVRSTGVNVYDLRRQCNKQGPLCYDSRPLNAFFQSERVKQALGVRQPWVECNVEVFQTLSADALDVWRNYERHIPAMLQNGHSVLIYAGEEDFLCNWLGNKAWTEKMVWPGQRGYADAVDEPWMVDGKVAGKVRNHKGLTFLRVNGAGHMVPMDQPKASLAMLNQYLLHHTVPEDGSGARLS